MSVLELRGVAKAFGAVKVLNGVSLSVDAGETVAVFGTSGSGKSILLRVIAGIFEPERGDVRVRGASVLGQPPEERGVAMAFQNFALYPHMTARQNIESPLTARKLGRADAAARVDETAKLLKIEGVLHHRPGELSNGQKQRTALARALVGRAPVMLLDDPLRNVDAKLRYQMRLELPRLLRRTEAATLYVTQDFREAMALGDRVAVLSQGRFAQIGRPAEVYADPDDVGIARLFGDPTINTTTCELDASNGVSNGRVRGRAFGAEVELPAGTGAEAQPSCTLGLRPERLEVALDELPGGIPVTLETVTPLNLYAALLLKARNGEELLATVPIDKAAGLPRRRTPAWMRFSPDAALLFDAESGRRMRGPDGSAERAAGG